MKRLWIKNEDGLVDVFNVRKHVLDYKPEGFDEKTPLGPRYIEVMPVEDHERIVAELQAEVHNLSESIAEAREVIGARSEDLKVDIGWLIEERDELRAEVAQAKREAADAMSGCCDCPMFKAQGKTVARQARVIEKLKGMVSHYETCATVDRYDDEEVPCDCGLEKELAAIEKG